MQQIKADAGLAAIKTPKPGAVASGEAFFTPSPPRLVVTAPADRWVDSKIPRSPLAKSPSALKCVHHLVPTYTEVPSVGLSAFNLL